jgi:hypothetical protein
MSRTFLVDAAGSPLPGSADWFAEYHAKLDAQRAAAECPECLAVHAKGEELPRQ